MAALATTDEWDSPRFEEQKVVGATYTIPVLEIKEERRKELQRQKVVARCTAIQVSVQAEHDLVAGCNSRARSCA